MGVGWLFLSCRLGDRKETVNVGKSKQIIHFLGEEARLLLILDISHL